MADAPRNTTWDTIIVGQGLAGTTLAWHLQDAGQKVLVLDASERVTSSKIAAGLITPVTGKRLAKSRDFDDFMPAARAFYTSVEKRTGRTFFHERRAQRLFRCDDERQKWYERREDPAYGPYLLTNQPTPLPEPELGVSSADGFAMRSAQLDVAAYLEASRSRLTCEPLVLDWHDDVEFGPDDVRVGAHSSRLIVSCEGFGAARNPHLSGVPFMAAKGDILTLRLHRPMPELILHHGIWLAPTKDADVFMAGSTYDWKNLNQQPCPAAKSSIEEQLRAFLHVPYTVLDHRAAVRPILSVKKVLIGLHPEIKQLAYFNGLGSKGSLQAPWYARLLTDFLVRGKALPEAVDVGQHFDQ